MELVLSRNEIYRKRFVGTGSVVFKSDWAIYNMPESYNPSYGIVIDKNSVATGRGQVYPEVNLYHSVGTILDESSSYINDLVSKRSDNYVTSLIGENGIKRLNIFQSSKAGWDNGKGKALKQSSVQMLNSFSCYFSNSQMKSISLFMTVNGNLSILLRDKDNRVIELEFYEDGIEYYFEGNGEEGKFDSEHINELAKRVEVLLA